MGNCILNVNIIVEYMTNKQSFDGGVLARKINMLFLFYKCVRRKKGEYVGNGQFYTKCEFSSRIHEK